MKEVTKCSISGVAFTLDTDAYEVLKGYLDTLKESYKETPDGAEIAADIEARIAELILSAQDGERVVEKPLIINIIKQMGSPEDLSEEYTDSVAGSGQPRIPRRLYRDTENAKLGGVCAGIAKYFDVDPTWVRLAMFLPLILTCLGWIPFLGWMDSIMGNLFAICVFTYLIMWFAVPVARTARQKLEMTGEKITAQSIRETTEASNDADSKAKPIVAEAVSVFGKIVLIGLKIFVGILVFGLIMCACALIIGLFAVAISGVGGLDIDFIHIESLWVPILGIFIALIPVILLIYVFMCLIASRKPNGKTVLVIFLLWITTIIACSCMAIRENFGEKLRERHQGIERIMHSDVVIDGDTTTIEGLLNDDVKAEAILDGNTRTLHISLPEKQIEISVDKDNASLSIKESKEQ